MPPQISYLVRCKLAMVAFVCHAGTPFKLVALAWLFSTMCFQMSPQIACLCGCKVTLVAFIWLFSKVCFQMSSQITCIKLTFSHCAFSSASSSFLFDIVHTCNGCICLCVSKCALKFLGPEMQNHILCICENFPYVVYLVCMQDCILTLFAFVWLFFAMYCWESE